MTNDELQKTLDLLYARSEELNDSFRTWRDRAAEIQEYLFPWIGINLSETSTDEAMDGSTTCDSIYDSTGQFAAETLASGLQTNLTNPMSVWFRFTTPDLDLRQNYDVKVWLDNADRTTRSVLSDSGVYRWLHSLYMELGTFGTCAGLLLEDSERVVRPIALTYGEYRLACDKRGQVDTLLRPFWMTARQIQEEFGEENTPENVRQAIRNKASETRYQISHLIEPNDDRMPVRDAKGHKWRAVYWMQDPNATTKQNRAILRVSGYDSKPFVAARWMVRGNGVYGFGPGHKALADVKQLQKLVETKLMALAKEVTPPMIADSSMSGKMINTFPNGINFCDMMTGANAGLRPLYNVRPNLQALDQTTRLTRELISRAFFADLFLMISGMENSVLAAGGTERYTATQVQAMREEKLQQIGPVVMRLHDELGSPTLQRCFYLATKAGRIDPPPEALRRGSVGIEYLSLLDYALRLAGVGNLNQFLGALGNVAAAMPDVMLVPRMDEIVREYADILAIPPRLLRSQAEVQGAMAQRAQMQEMQARLQMLETAAKGARTLSEADLNGNTALAALLGRPQ